MPTNIATVSSLNERQYSEHMVDSSSLPCCESQVAQFLPSLPTMVREQADSTVSQPKRAFDGGFDAPLMDSEQETRLSKEKDGVAELIERAEDKSYFG
jgi:hypothetical protein